MVETKSLIRMIELASVGGMIDVVRLRCENGITTSVMSTEGKACLQKVTMPIDIGTPELTLPVEWVLTRLKHAGDNVKITPKGKSIFILGDRFESRKGLYEGPVNEVIELNEKNWAVMDKAPYMVIDAKEIHRVVNARKDFGVNEYQFQFIQDGKNMKIFLILGDLTGQFSDPARFLLSPTKHTFKPENFAEGENSLTFSSMFEEVFKQVSGEITIRMLPQKFRLAMSVFEDEGKTTINSIIAGMSPTDL